MDYINGLEQKVKFTLGPNRKIFSNNQIEFEGSYTLIESFSQSILKISIYFELMKFCELNPIPMTSGKDVVT